MNVSFFLKKWLTNLLSKLGVEGLTNELSAYVGSTVAGVVVRTLVKDGVAAAVTKLFAKIGETAAGWIGLIIGAVLGCL